MANPEFFTFSGFFYLDYSIMFLPKLFSISAAFFLNKSKQKRLLLIQIFTVPVDGLKNNSPLGLASSLAYGRSQGSPYKVTRG